jgi:hypothetical protein
MRIIILFAPQNHPWKREKISLGNWAEHSSELNNAFSLNFWVALIFGTIAIILILTNN